MVYMLAPAIMGMINIRSSMIHHNESRQQIKDAALHYKNWKKYLGRG